MPEENLQSDIDTLKAANAAIESHKAELAAEVAGRLAAAEARLTVSEQQLADLRAEIANTVTLGKPSLGK